MKYRNIKTGAIINIASVLTGEDWECLTQPKIPKNKAEEPKLKTSKVNELEISTPEAEGTDTEGEKEEKKGK